MTTDPDALTLRASRFDQPSSRCRKRTRFKPSPIRCGARRPASSKGRQCWGLKIKRANAAARSARGK